MFNIAVLVSGGGTNLQAVIDYTKREDVDARVSLVISDRHGAYALERASKAGIENVVLERKIYKGELSNEILSRVSGCDLIVLAGFLSILSGEILKIYENKIINVHPSLIPSFCGPKMYGINVHQAAIDKGVKISGCSVHIVDAGTDTGRILVQKAVRVEPGDTAQSLAARILPYEHEALCEAIGMCLKEARVEKGEG